MSAGRIISSIARSPCRRSEKALSLAADPRTRRSGRPKGIDALPDRMQEGPRGRDGFHTLSTTHANFEADVRNSDASGSNGSTTARRGRQ